MLHRLLVACHVCGMGQTNEHPLRAFRLRKNLTQDEVAAKIGFSRFTIIRIEQGQVMPSRQAMLAIERWTKRQVTRADLVAAKAK